jgi:putative ABC transport system permease protein
MDIVRQHLLEVILVGVLGGAMALLLTLAGLEVLKRWLFYDMLGGDDPDRVALANALVHIDFTVLLYGVALALLTGVLAGLYPAIRIGRLAPATFLKTQ